MDYDEVYFGKVVTMLQKPAAFINEVEKRGNSLF